MNHISSSIAPAQVPVLGHLPAMLKDPLNFFVRASRDHGDVVPLNFGNKRLHLINHPDHLVQVFRTNRENYVRSKYYGELTPFLGVGMFTMEGDEWLEHRRSAQKSVSGPNLKGMIDKIVDSSNTLVRRLDGYARSGQPFDMNAVMIDVTLDIVMRCFFGARLSPEQARVVDRAFSTVLREVERRFWTLLPNTDWLPTPKARMLRQALADLDVIVYGIIDDRLANPTEEVDLLSMLIDVQSARHPENMRENLRDQMIHFMLAGHETGANSMTWSYYELAKNPHVLRTFQDEVDGMLDGREPEFADFPQLQYTQQLYKEVLRLYPPAWSLSRMAVEDDRLGEHVIPAGDDIMACAYTMHRHPAFWDNPEGFDPDRFTPDKEKDLIDHQYFPFGSGKHLCLGNRFSVLEGVLVLSQLAQNFDFELLTGQTIYPMPYTTTKPNGPVMMKASLRQRPAKTFDMAVPKAQVA